jgi:hypothetical protein
LMSVGTTLIVPPVLMALIRGQSQDSGPSSAGRGDSAFEEDSAYREERRGDERAPG